MQGRPTWGRRGWHVHTTLRGCGSLPPPRRAVEKQALGSHRNACPERPAAEDPLSSNWQIPKESRKQVRGCWRAGGLLWQDWPPSGGLYL